AETDPDKQKQMWTDFTAKAYDMWVSVGLVQLPTNWVLSDNLGEFTKNSHRSMQASWGKIQHP
ncbi:MAG: hypothetical protein V3S02_05080, partial [Dehalococcoidales bacterium]